jgi:DNA-binding protein Fis
MPESLPLEIQQETEPSLPTSISYGNISLQEMEKLHILEVLKSVEGNKSQAARILDISRSTLREKLKSYQIAE